VLKNACLARDATPGIPLQDLHQIVPSTILFEGLVDRTGVGAVSVVENQGFWREIWVKGVEFVGSAGTEKVMGVRSKEISVGKRAGA